MKKLNVAVLEDSPTLLKDLIENIKHLGLAKVLAHATNTDDFIAKVKQNPNIDALILDIDIIGDSMNGIDVANSIQLPTLFISGKTKDYINGIEDLRIYNEQPIEFLTKPVKDERLKKVFEKFERQIKNFEKEVFIVLKLANGFEEKVKQQDIIYIESIPNSTSNNKLIFLDTHEEPIEVSKTSMNDFFDKGLSKENFEKTHQSYIINKSFLNLRNIKRGDQKYKFKYFVNENEVNSEISLSREFLQKMRKSKY